MRDPRRNFTRRQKDEMLIREGFACADCRRPFDRERPGPRRAEGWAMGRTTVNHHEIPWAGEGPTIIENGSVLCRHCHHFGRSRAFHSWCPECQEIAALVREMYAVGMPKDELCRLVQVSRRTLNRMLSAD
jgi:hypothetical protein